MGNDKAFKLNRDERLFLRLSKSGKGVYITNGVLKFGLRGSFDHVKAVLKKEKDFAVLEVREKQGSIQKKDEEAEEEYGEEW